MFTKTFILIYLKKVEKKCSKATTFMIFEMRWADRLQLNLYSIFHMFQNSIMEIIP